MKRPRMKNSRASSDNGAAMVVTLLVMAVLTGVGAIVFNIGLNNMQNAGRDRLAGGALGASEGGVAQALTFVRSNGVGQMKCEQEPEVIGSCDALWGKYNPKIVALSGGKEFRVWVEKVQPFDPPDFKVGTYMIHSTGTAGKGPGRRDLEVTFTVKPLTFPIGIYAENGFNDAGGASVTTVSILSKACITGLKLMTFKGDDPYHKTSSGGPIPAAAHSVDVIAAQPNSCSALDTIHLATPLDEGDCPQTPTDPDSVPPNKPKYRNHQDKFGGPLNTVEGAPCQGLAGAYPQDSSFDLEDLEAYGYNNSAPRGLTDAEYKQLKSKAQEQNYFFTSVDKCGGAQSPPTCWREPDALADPNAVMYWDLRGAPANKKQVSFQGGDLDGDPNGNPNASLYGGGNKNPDGYCGKRSLVIVVEGGNMKVNSGVDIVGAIFVPDGSYTGNGNHNILGILFAKVVEKFTGTANFTLTGPGENCFFDNFPGGLLSVTTVKFHEKDR